MTAKKAKTNDLAGKLEYTGQHVLRVTADGKDFVFVPGTEYENLPESEYLVSLLKQGYFKPVKSDTKTNV